MSNKLAKQLIPIFAQVGSVVQASQQMEVGIGFALTMLRQLSDDAFSDEDFDESISLFSKKTLGALIKEFRKHCQFDDDSLAAFELALDERNFVIHKYFNHNPESFIKREGRAEMASRINEARKNIDPGVKVVDGIVTALLNLSGYRLEDVMRDVQGKIEL